MASISRSRASLDNLTDMKRYDTAHFTMFLTGVGADHGRPSADVRMGLVNSLRTAIAQGQYFVSSADLAQKMMQSMGEDPVLRLRRDSSDAGPSSLRSSLPTHGYRHATFPPRQASESAEEVNDERVGKTDCNRRS